MSDYPRVLAHDFTWIPALVGGPATHKVVPGDAIVIERGDLPGVDTTGGVRASYTGPSGPGVIGWDDTFIREDCGMTARRARAQALAFLAIAEYLDAHPPVNEAQVRALASDLALAMGIPNDSDAVARVLVEQGWTRRQVTP